MAWLVFLGAVFIGSYVQSVAGFAIGMIVMAVGGASGTIALPALTAAVSIISFVNIVVAMKGHLPSVNRQLFGWLAVGQIPAVGLGVWLITVLDRDAQWVLQMLLGTFITIGSLSMMVRPVPLKQLSPRWACFAAGLGGGLIGGMFSASGPIIGWFTYRQPLGLAAIRATMLAFFALATCERTAIVGFQGGLTREVLWLSLVALPFVVSGAWLGRTMPPPITEAVMKRSVFCLLFLMGIYIIYNAL